jgi:hypothetical protein
MVLREPFAVSFVSLLHPVAAFDVRARMEA